MNCKPNNLFAIEREKEEQVRDYSSFLAADCGETALFIVLL